LSPGREIERRLKCGSQITRNTPRKAEKEFGFFCVICGWFFFSRYQSLRSREDRDRVRRCMERGRKPEVLRPDCRRHLAMFESNRNWTNSCRSISSFATRAVSPSSLVSISERSPSCLRSFITIVQCSAPRCSTAWQLRFAFCLFRLEKSLTL